MEKLENIKVIFVDIDGTLTDSKKELPQKNAEIIKKVVDKGIMVVLCSGRSDKYAETRSKLANASSLIIVNNGAQIYDYAANKNLHSVVIPKETISKVINYLEEHNDEYILNTFNRRFTSKGLARKRDKWDKELESLAELEENEIYQIVTEASSFEKLEELIEYINSVEGLKILNYSPAYLKGNRNMDHYYLDVNCEGINKGVAIQEFLKIFNISKEDSMCFGDHVNDMDMFDVCGVKVAMGNANKKLKEKATYVTYTNDECGVGRFLEEHIL